MKRPTVHQRYPNQPAPAATIASTTAIIARLRQRADQVCGLSDGLSAGGGPAGAMVGAATGASASRASRSGAGSRQRRRISGSMDARASTAVAAIVELPNRGIRTPVSRSTYIGILHLPPGFG